MAFELLKEAANKRCTVIRRNEILKQLCPAFYGTDTPQPSREQIQVLAGTILLCTFCQLHLPELSKDDVVGLFPLIAAGVCDKSETSWLGTVDWIILKKLNK